MKKTIFFVSILLLVIGLSFARPSTVFSSYDVVQEKVNPGDDYKYIIKRFKEKISLTFLSIVPGRKIIFLSKLVDVRLSELNYVIAKTALLNFQPANPRYSFTAANAPELILVEGSKEDRQKLIEKFKNQIPVLNKLQEPYVPDNSEWRFLQDDINSLDSYVSKLSE